MAFNLKQYLDELEYIVNIDSGSNTPEGTKKVASFFAQKYQELGWDVELIQLNNEIGPLLKINNKKNSHHNDVLLLGHMDTVFPEGTVMERPFKIEEGKAYGPGVNDMKAGLLSMYYAIEKLQKDGDLDESSVCILLNSDEEISSRYSNALIKEEAKKSKYAFILEPARTNGSMVNERKGLGRYFIHFEGVATHAGVEPEKGISAIEELGNWIVKLQQLTDFEVGTTVNVGVVSGGTGANVVADKAYAEVDLRVKKVEEAERIDGIIREMEGKPFVNGVKVKVKGGVTRPPMNPSAETLELCEKILDIAERMNIKAGWVATGGGSDGNFTAAEGVPTVDSMGPVGSGSHGSNEYIIIDTVEPRINLVVESLKIIL